MRVYNMAAPMKMLAVRNFCFRPKHLAQKPTFRKYCTIKRSIQEILSAEIPEGGQLSVVAEGWVRGFRSLKWRTFVDVSDGSSRDPLQVIVNPETFEKLPYLYGSSIRIDGHLINSEASGQAVELIADNIQVTGTCPAQEYPFRMKKKQKPTYDRGFPHLNPKTTTHSALLRVRNAATMAVHKYFQENGFLFVHTPILTSSDCEGAGEVFSVKPAVTESNIPNNDNKPRTHAMQSESDKSQSDERQSDETDRNFFSSPTFLTVSGQLHLETITGAFKKAYNFGPVFRAEKSRTMHHLSEFYMIEAEEAFTEDLSDIIKTMEKLVQFTTKEVLDTATQDLEYFWKNPELDTAKNQDIMKNIVEKQYIRLTYSEALQILTKKKKQFKQQVKWGDDFSKEHEQYLVKHCDNIPVFLTDFPSDLKPFYCRQNPDGKTASAVDLLVPRAGELCGGTMREDNLELLQQRMAGMNNAQDYNWYLDLRRFGSTPHGGFGMGFERYLQFLLGIANIKDTIPFPRWYGSCQL